jgi:undecaprenyl-diphosphatase
VVILFYRRWGWLYLFMAAAVSYSRIYVGAHWPTDVLASIFLGAGVGVLVTTTAERLWRKWGAAIAPRLHRVHPSLGVHGFGLKAVPMDGPGPENSAKPFSS